MSCTYDYQDDEAMAENGWTQDEINQLRLEVQLAEAEAGKDAYDMGLTLAQQQQMQAKAKEKALQVGHDRFHRRLEAFMKSIQAAGAEKVPAGHSHSHHKKEAGGPIPVNPALKKLFEDS